MSSFEQIPNPYFESGKKKIVSLPEGEPKKGILKFRDRRWKIDPVELEEDSFLLSAYETDETDITYNDPDINGESSYEISIPMSIINEALLSKAEMNGWSADLSGKEYAVFEKNKKRKTVH